MGRRPDWGHSLPRNWDSTTWLCPGLGRSQEGVLLREGGLHGLSSGGPQQVTPARARGRSPGGAGLGGFPLVCPSGHVAPSPGVPRSDWLCHPPGSLGLALPSSCVPGTFSLCSLRLAGSPAPLCLQQVMCPETPRGRTPHPLLWVWGLLPARLLGPELWPRLTQGHLSGPRRVPSVCSPMVSPTVRAEAGVANSSHAP